MLALQAAPPPSPSRLPQVQPAWQARVLLLPPAQRQLVRLPPRGQLPLWHPQLQQAAHLWARQWLRRQLAHLRSASRCACPPTAPPTFRVASRSSGASCWRPLSARCRVRVFSECSSRGQEVGLLFMCFPLHLQHASQLLSK